MNPSTEQITCKFIIQGKVQGVWFRASTKQQADRLNISGYANNLPDGSVEVLASGKHQDILTLERWLHTGPELAHVHSVLKSELHDDEMPPAYDGFITG